MTSRVTCTHKLTFRERVRHSGMRLHWWRAHIHVTADGASRVRLGGYRRLLTRQVRGAGLGPESSRVARIRYMARSRHGVNRVARAD